MAKAAAKPSITDVLNMPAQNAERPPTLPRGFYITVVQSFREDKSSIQQTPFVEYQLKVLEPYKDVDEDELEEFGDVNGSIINVQYYLTDKAAYRLKDFLMHCGVDLRDGRSFKQAIPDAVNCQVIAQIQHRPWQSGEGVSARVSNTAPVE